MALSDLDILNLLEKAKEKRTGPPGPPGIGLRSGGVVQVGEQIRFEFTDGSSATVTMPAGIEGKQGPAGADGRDGVDGITGLRGPTGPVGPAGPVGAAGRSVEATAVTEDGRLLFEWSDGIVETAGFVMGPQGRPGAQGAPGAKGKDGEDGAGWLSGPRPPAESDGEVGDHWLDYAGEELPLYKKLLSGWKRIGSMKPRGSGGGAEFKRENIVEGGEIQDTGDLPLSSPNSGSAPPPPFFDPAFQPTEYITNSKPSGHYPDGMPIWPPHDKKGHPIPNADYIYSNPYELEWQHQYNTWVYECLQRLAAFHKNWSTIDGGNVPNLDAEGAPITWKLDGGDRRQTNNPDNHIVDGNYSI